MKNLVDVYFGPYKKSVLRIIILLIIQVILQIFIIIMIKPIISEGIKSADTETIFVYGIFMLLLIIFYSVTTVIVAKYSARISADSVSRIREDMFAKIFSFKRPRDSGANMSGLMNRLVTDVNNIQNFMTEFLCTGLYIPLLALAVIIVSAVFVPLLTVSLTIAFFAMILVTIILAKREVQIRSRIQRMLDRMLQLFRDILLGARASRAYDTERAQRDTFSEYNQEYSNLVTSTTSKVSIFASLSTFVLILVIIFTYPLMIINFSDMNITADELIVFIQFLVLYITCANITPFLVTTVPLVKAAFGRISKVMNGQSEMPGDHVPDDYDGPLLECRNGLKVERGTETTMVGRSGSGRGEFIRCLLRLDDVGPGEMTFKGKDVSELDPRELRGSIAYAGNLALAFRGSVHNNITVWRDIPEERVRQAMEAAKLELDGDFILDAQGSNISMGQIQKISIARALASDADLYIFDDCFTELDPKTENEIVSNIRGMLKGRTVLFSSHQFRISPGSDVVDVMDAGRIIDSGSHDDLIGRCDLYRRMYLAGGGLSD